MVLFFLSHIVISLECKLKEIFLIFEIRERRFSENRSLKWSLSNKLTAFFDGAVFYDAMSGKAPGRHTSVRVSTKVFGKIFVAWISCVTPRQTCDTRNRGVLSPYIFHSTVWIQTFVYLFHWKDQVTLLWCLISSNWTPSCSSSRQSKNFA